MAGGRIVEHCTECGREITGKSVNGNHICIACFKQREISAGNASFYAIYRLTSSIQGGFNFEKYHDGINTYQAALSVLCSLQAIDSQHEYAIMFYPNRKAPAKIYGLK